jgi:hypothetical protein
VLIEEQELLLDELLLDELLELVLEVLIEEQELLLELLDELELTSGDGP